MSLQAAPLRRRSPGSCAAPPGAKAVAEVIDGTSLKPTLWPPTKDSSLAPALSCGAPVRLSMPEDPAGATPASTTVVPGATTTADDAGAALVPSVPAG